MCYGLGQCPHEHGQFPQRRTDNPTKPRAPRAEQILAHHADDLVSALRGVGRGLHQQEAGAKPEDDAGRFLGRGMYPSAVWYISSFCAVS